MDDGLPSLDGHRRHQVSGELYLCPRSFGVCAAAMKAGMQHIEPILSDSGIEPIGTVIMGTVKGDLHDIGKNLCINDGCAVQASWYTIWGVDTSEDEFIEAVEVI